MNQNLRSNYFIMQQVARLQDVVVELGTVLSHSPASTTPHLAPVQMRGIGDALVSVGVVGRDLCSEVLADFEQKVLTHDEKG